MERIIKLWEELIGSIIVNGYIFIISFGQIHSRTYEYNENLNPLINKYFIFLYIAVWIFYIRLFVREIVLYKRINTLHINILYSPNNKIQVLKTIIILIGHITYWILFATGTFNIIIFIVTTLILFLAPSIISTSIFETDDYIIYSGIKYYYNDIAYYKEEFGYRIGIRIKGKEKDINICCGNTQKYDIICERLKYMVK